jgi:hypothetical protein
MLWRGSKYFLTTVGIRLKKFAIETPLMVLNQGQAERRLWKVAEACALGQDATQFSLQFTSPVDLFVSTAPFKPSPLPVFIETVVNYLPDVVV